VTVPVLTNDTTGDTVLPATAKIAARRIRATR